MRGSGALAASDLIELAPGGFQRYAALISSEAGRGSLRQFVLASILKLRLRMPLEVRPETGLSRKRKSIWV